MNYNHEKIEAKWQEKWSENQTFKTEKHSEKPKFYVLDMFPYPSGAGLHVGHPLGYIASDIFARYKRHKGFNVLHPQGYDSFGLPAEQYAIQTGQHPEKTTRENIARYREQLDKIGFSFDWSREVRTSNADYYKWTQWIFIQLFHSWYNNTANKAEDIQTLVQHFEKFGTEDLNAAQTEELHFTAEQWKNYSEEEKQNILLNYRLAFRAETTVNWCPALGTVLANDEVVNGVSERGGYPVFQKKMMQWSMRITAYSERLLQGLETVDWSESVKESQRNWIGKSKGASIKFKVLSSKSQDLEPETSNVEHITVFTTRPDTIFGVTYLTLAPEHELVLQITTEAQKQAVLDYIEATSKRSERDRMADTKTISGVFTGAYAVCPATGYYLPIWIGDYVLAGYGTGAVMAVPAGDERDYAFAKHFAGAEGMPEIINIFDKDISENAFTEKGGFKLQNSDFLNGMDYEEATEKILEELEKTGVGKAKINYRQRDAIFSRQRYWGEPVPVYYKNGMPYTLPLSALPLELPEVEKYLPTEDGDPPLGNAKEYAWNEAEEKIVSTDLIDNQTVFPLELSTMPGWAGSSWYWLRYMDAHNKKEFASQDSLNYWQNVDLYIGGSEHATGHLLYSRFWNKFLKDRGFIQAEEPFQKMINQGMILGTSAFVYRLEGTNTFVSKGQIGDKKVQAIHADVSLVNASSELDIEGFKQWRPDFADAEFILDENGKYIVGHEVEKMSKSKYNVVNPDDICEQYGADTLRLYEMFLGPLEQAKPWNTAGITGVSGFLKKFYNLYFDGDAVSISDEEPTKEEYKILHTLIKKVEYDIENFSFNTSVSAFMIAVNELQKIKCNKRAILEPMAVLISPYAPHIAEELWEVLGHNESISRVPFPTFEEQYLVESTKEYPVSFNGKVRFKIELPLDMPNEEVEKIILADERTQAQLGGNPPKKIIVVKGKIVNVVV
ncbi:Leucine--tRNA ligase [Capnocytophaga canimorsus]|uniref:Leucine--tRNA ligase n=1 Tax=Capnocytophaga canimorsus TaxID=28188 RepID=A0A0B7H4Z1_9FLAO|nr:leucine--tRNA ligase [Capnocytophaga canimorsus]ATA77003.1 leucine--tRNA ligase [Capnocytophaga canimorsus]PJI83862.1 leucyl-tRNA synthetase [Capnocytophaga canimorsus]CEN33599.1 Leucine--tRNA ligase [Capnocytophaga canimorsus]STA72211.1 Leucine--tRNA ligase [Capnocytophaga canimorsus]